MHLNSGELHNFLNTCRLGTLLRGSKTLSVCTDISGLHPMGWSVSWSIRGTIITFTETLKTKENVETDLANLPKSLANT